MILSIQPTTYDVTDIAYKNVKPTRGKVGVVLWGSQYDLIPNSNKSKVSTFPSFSWSTNIEALGDTIGINIEALTDRKNLKERFGLGTIVLSNDLLLPITPFAKENVLLSSSFSMSIPKSTAIFGGTSQVVAYFNFTDTISKQSFWLGAILFDKRIPPIGEKVYWDQGTSSPMVLAPIGASNISHSFTDKSYSDMRNYVFTVSSENLKAAINLINNNKPNSQVQNFSVDPSKYMFRHSNINPEIRANSFFSYARIQVYIKNWQVDLI